MKKSIITLLIMAFSAIQSIAQIDLHSHAITKNYIDYIKANGAELDEGFPIPAWDVEKHLSFMDEAGIQSSVLTMPAPQPYFGDAEASALVCRSFNEECTALKARYPDRFMFCAALPLPDVNAAIREAVYALDTLKADGVKLATNAYGQYLGGPELDTLFSVLNERGAVVILHPHRPEPVNQQVMQQTPLAMQEYLSETTRAVANMITRNVLARYPNVKVVVPHCGAYLPLAVPRMKSLTAVMQANKMVGEIDWQANLNSLYFDLAGAHSPEVIRMMLTITTPDHLLYGSDYPYVAPQVVVKGLQRMQQYLTDEPDLEPYKEMILYKNALKLFGKTNEESASPVNTDEKIVRLAEIEVEPEFLEEYMAFAKEVGETSVKVEPGVLTLFSMQTKEDPCKIYILEIYADQEAYQSHIQTAHFKKYKEGTAMMVKSLKLIDVNPLAGTENIVK